MDTKRFDTEVGGLTSTLGDPTRRGIYVAVRESSEPATVSVIASAFDIHANVARHHLDRLVEDGYLRVTSHARRKGAGRPAKRYEATAKEIAIQFPARRHDLLAEMLVKVVERLDPVRAGIIAEEVGREYGAQLAAEIGLPEDPDFAAAVTSVARAMTGLGFDVKGAVDDRRLLTRSCPFGQTALDHPAVICRLDQGIVAGLVGAVHQGATPVVIPHTVSGEACITCL
jgi:predicted ArsR family transcriptional regulator